MMYNHMEQSLIEQFYPRNDCLKYKGPKPSTAHEAWAITLSKWYVLAYKEGFMGKRDSDRDTCGLCMLYFDEDTAWNHHCDECPIGIAGYNACAGTPYDHYHHLNTATKNAAAAKEELHFLVKELLLTLPYGARYGFRIAEGNRITYNGPHPPTLEYAWNMAIAKWCTIYLADETIVNGFSGGTCGLCIYNGYSCSNCPIYLLTQERDCGDTPYADYVLSMEGEDARKAALMEIIFLLQAKEGFHVHQEIGLNIKDIKVGDQIAYVPGGAVSGDVFNNPATEYGFVTAVNSGYVWCRFWRKDEKVLRTTSCSEPAKPSSLVRSKDYASQHDIDTFLRMLGYVKD